MKRWIEGFLLICFSLSILSIYSSGFALDQSQTSFDKTTTANAEMIHSLNHSEEMSVTNGVTSPVMSVEAFNALPKSRQETLAKIFNISIEEYQQYLHDMNDTIDGYEYQHNINPNFILAMHTQDKSKYQTYIKNTIMEDRQAIGALLQVNRDYTHLAKQLYPAEKPIMLPNDKGSMKGELKGGDVLQIYCQLTDPTCSNLIHVWLPSVMNTPSTQLDIFGLDHATQQDLIKFAKNNRIDSSLVSAHRVTLNYGDAPFAQVEAQARKKLVAPFVLLKRKGVEMPFGLKRGS